MNDRRKVTVIYSGRVQGVGFRARVFDLAQRFAVKGQVCNVNDGTVELVGIGSQQELDNFLAAIEHQMVLNIHNSTKHWSDVEPVSDEEYLERYEQFRIAPDKWG